jgi:hypothetical protein
MQVGILPTAPLPGGVKVARRSVKPFGVGASPTLAAIFIADFGFSISDCCAINGILRFVNRKSAIVNLVEGRQI